MIDGKKILITGGTGSFGVCMVKHLLTNYSPEKVLVYSRNEEKQVAMRREIHSDKLRFYIGDVRDQERLKLVFKDVNYVIHLAALKHVDVCSYDPEEAKKTNVDGAANVVAAAIENKVSKVIAISSDKAVSPTTTYGASKLLGDYLFLNGNKLSTTKFSVVRFGNFEGSSGSVAQFFQKLKEENMGLLPITDYRMTRYFIPLEEAVKFTVMVLEVMEGGEIYVPKMRKEKIVDLAKRIYPEAKAIEIGRRQGEKLDEDLITEPDMVRTREVESYYVTSDKAVGRVIDFKENDDIPLTNKN